MELKTSRVHRALEAKIKIAGMEASDLFLVLILANFMELILGHTQLRGIFVFVLPLILTALLFWTKRGKPENYLLYLIRYHCSPSKYSAGASPKDEEQRKRKIYKVAR